MNQIKHYSFLILFLLFTGMAGAQTCIDFSCRDLLHPIPTVKADRDSANGDVKKYYYGKSANRSPVDYNSYDHTCSTAGDSLFFTVTYPENYDYVNCPALPCIAMFHPGGFKDGTSYYPFRKYADEFAKRGYVVFNVEYRRGWDAEPAQNDYISTGQMIANYRANQDIRGALKTIVRLKNEGAFVNCNFDLNKFYIGGASAGAFMCINLAYVSQGEINQVAPGLQGLLGNLNSPLVGSYYGSGTPLPDIKGVLCMWGAGPGLLNGASPSYIGSNETIPFIGFHGELDDVAPYDRRTEYYCDDSKNSEFAAINQCADPLNLQFDIRSQDNDPGADYTNYGSYAIYQRLKALGVPTEIYLDSDMGHGLDTSSDFGIGTNNQNSVISYMIGRAATFFQAVANGNYALTQTKFVDCENTRKGCDAEVPNACAASKAAITSTVAGDAHIKVAPNPASAELYISSGEGAISQVRIYDLEGKLLLRQAVNSPKVRIYTNTFKHVAKGLYIVEARIGTIVSRKKIIIN